MRASAWGTVARERLLGRIFLLHLLNETFEKPSENSINESNIQDGTSSARVLSLRREKELVEILAFLSASTDDPGKVMALCVEECQNGNAMTVRMAVNNGGLDVVKDSFEKMARILERAATQDRSLSKNREDALLREIVVLNRKRILCRLRSKHATLNCNYSKGKRQRLKVLPEIEKAVAKVRTADLPSVPATVIENVKQKVQILHRLFTKLEEMTKPQVLSETGLKLITEIVIEARGLDPTGILGTILTSSGLQPSSVTAFPTIIMKLGRYSSGTRFLVRAAEELSIFRSIETSVIKLPPLPGLLIADPATFVPAMLDGIFDASEIEDAAVITRARLKWKYSRISDFSSTKFVVHAEIQLLFYYELHPTELAPRLICSSKKACFLCNLFVKLHGKFIIPSSHGKLYEKWTLPERIDELQGARAKFIRAVMERFNDTVVAELRLELQTSRRPYPSPLESTNFASAIWSSPHRSETTSPSTVSHATSTTKLRSRVQNQSTEPQDYRQNIRDTKVDMAIPIYQCSEGISGDTPKHTQTSISDL